MLLELLGLTPEQIAEGESWDPKKGKRTKDLGDRVGRWNYVSPELALIMVSAYKKQRKGNI